MMTEVQTPNHIITLDSPNKKIKLNNEGIGNLKVDATDAYKEILQVEIRKREKAEGDVAALNRRIKLLEEDLMRAETRCATATQKWKEAESKQSQSKTTSGQAPGSVSVLKPINKELDPLSLGKIEHLEAENLAKKIQGLLSLPLGEFPKQAKVIADETVKKFKAATNKLAMVEANLAQAQEKSQQDESKIVELENEMKVLSKSLQVSMIELKEEAPSEEVSFSNIGAVAQDQYVQKLQNEVEKLKEELQTEQERNKNLQEEMEATLQDIQNM